MKKELNRDAILRRPDTVISHYGDANQGNELDFGVYVDMIISWLETYVQVWDVRHIPHEGEHSRESIALAKEELARLEEI